MDDLVLLAAARLRVGGRRLRALARGDADAVRAYVQNDSARRLAEARRDARADLVALHGLGARLIALGDDEYPAGLRDLRDPPAFLTVRGTLPRSGVAIVGARDASAGARAYAAELVAALGQPVVSGLAHGIDAAAHRAALAADLPQVAYVGTGLGRTYPPDHAELAEALAARGALASERLPDEPVTRWSLVRRDRLQAAHAWAVVLVESAADGGAMHAVATARGLGRPCFALDTDASGNRVAVAEGALRLGWNAATAAAQIRHHQPLTGASGLSPTFNPFDLEKAKRLTGGDLDALPFGVIVVDRQGTILEYNAYERQLAHMGERKMIGLNFFHDVAPCTAIAEFEGRFTAFLDSPETSIEPFEFVFPFPRGAQRVNVIFVRVSDDSERATICVVRDELPAPPAP